MTPLERLNSLDRTKHTAFLALFAGARHHAQVTRSGDDGRERFPDFGKAECGWVDDPRDFYSRELPELGLIEFSETEPRRALGMVAGSTCWDATIVITKDGWEAREAWWAELNAKGAAEDGQAEAEKSPSRPARLRATRRDPGTELAYFVGGPAAGEIHSIDAGRAWFEFRPREPLSIASLDLTEPVPQTTTYTPVLYERHTFNVDEVAPVVLFAMKGTTDRQILEALLAAYATTHSQRRKA